MQAEQRASAPATDGFERLLPTPGAIYRCRRRQKGRSCLATTQKLGNVGLAELPFTLASMPSGPFDYRSELIRVVTAFVETRPRVTGSRGFSSLESTIFAEIRRHRARSDIRG